MQTNVSNLLQRLDGAERLFATIIGVVFLVVGIAGFIPGLIAIPAVAGDAPLYVPDLSFPDGYGNVFGLFPTNFLHNAVHIAVGILGLAAATSFSGSLVFNQGFAISYILIAIMGLLPATNTTFGLMPIFGNNVWFNALTGLAAAYFGFIKPLKVQSEITSAPKA
uniref:DUF4383 domain-containing protein n=1 Tax=Trichocoleus desertorum TaxID=1481672 RepID=UPI0025B626A7|nr:DUF4383 domain-containing protein [Trichocoleus desertorum]